MMSRQQYKDKTDSVIGFDIRFFASNIQYNFIKYKKITCKHKNLRKCSKHFTEVGTVQMFHLPETTGRSVDKEHMC